VVLPIRYHLGSTEAIPEKTARRYNLFEISYDGKHLGLV
jgi:hypothetical protein